MGRSENVLVAHMTWMDYDQRIRETSPVVMVPVGAVEQHGPHLPLTTDTLVPAAVCERVAQRTGNLVAPPVTYGYKSLPRSGGGQHFPGTTSLDASVLIAQLTNLISEFARHGVRNLAFIAGHLENVYFITEACDLGLRELRRDGIDDMQILQVGYWEFTSEGDHQHSLARWPARLVAGARRGDGDLHHAAPLPRAGAHGPADRRPTERSADLPSSGPMISRRSPHPASSTPLGGRARSTASCSSTSRWRHCVGCDGRSVRPSPASVSPVGT